MFRSLSRIAIPIIMLAAVTVPTVPAASVSRAATVVPPYAQPYAQTLTVNIGQPTANPLPPKITMQNNPLIPYLDKHAYLIALLGVLFYYGIQSRHSFGDKPKSR